MGNNPIFTIREQKKGLCCVYVRLCYVGMTPVAKRMISKTMMNKTTPIIIIILVFFHQYFLETRAEVL